MAAQVATKRELESPDHVNSTLLTGLCSLQVCDSAREWQIGIGGRPGNEQDWGRGVLRDVGNE